MDIDIDTPSAFAPLNFFDVTQASMVKDGMLVKHPCGTYFQNVPKDKLTGLAAIPYEAAESAGFFKVDFLHLSLLDYFSSKEEIRFLISLEPDWSLLDRQDVVEKLSQLHRSYKVVKQIRPRSIQEVADTIALIRPAKKHLLGAYITDREKTRKELYAKPNNDAAYFKRAHAVAYSHNIVLQLHLIKGNIL